MSGPTEGNLNSTTPAAPSGKQNVVFQADTAYIDPATGLPERDISAYPQPATSSLEGTIMLAGDIGGTADVPKAGGHSGYRRERHIAHQRAGAAIRLRQRALRAGDAVGGREALGA